jgi:putative transcriptional regulator
MKHHPKTETLATYAAGAFDEAQGVVVSTHLAVCAACREVVRDFETLGGACLEAIPARAMDDGALDRFWTIAGEQERPNAESARQGAPDMMRTLDRYLKDGIDGAKWRRIVPGAWDCVLPARGYRPGALRLLKIQPGTRIPKHAHAGAEFTLLLKGAYDDELGSFAQGDFVDLDADDAHSPLAVGDEPCICLIAANAPLVFKGVAARVFQPFLGL